MTLVPETSAPDGPLSSRGTLDGGGVEDPIVALVQRVDLEHPGYLDRARAAAARLSVRPRIPGDLRSSLAEVRATARVDVDAPVASNYRFGRFVKTTVRRLVGFCLRYLADQIGALGESIGDLGEDLVDVTEDVALRLAASEQRVATLERRVVELETEAPGKA